MANDFGGKTAVVTGGTRGIGLSIARAFLEEGANVFVCGRTQSSLASALEELARAGGSRAAGIAADVRRHEDCRKLIETAAERFGGIDVLVNNAGVGLFKPVDEITPEEWDSLIATNLSGAFYCTREVVPHLRRRRGGYIFNVSSLAGINAFPGGTAYNASKFGLNGFSEALMQDLRYDGIRVSYLLPGSVDTGFRPSAGGAPQTWKLTGEDVAKAVIDLYRFPARALASRIELRPSQPPKKG